MTHTSTSSAGSALQQSHRSSHAPPHCIDFTTAVESVCGPPAAQINDLELHSETVKASMAQMEQGAREVAEQLKKSQGQYQEQEAQLQESAVQQEQLRWASVSTWCYRASRPA